MYSNGQGVLKDNAFACVWVSLACYMAGEMGYEEREKTAEKRMDTASQEMTITALDMTGELIKETFLRMQNTLGVKDTSG